MEELKKLKITRSEIVVVLTVTLLSGMIIVPSLLKCVINKGRYKCENHIYKIMHVLSDRLIDEEQNGGTYWHDMLVSGNLSRLIKTANAKTGESDKFPSSDYYAELGNNSISIYCKKHPNMSEKKLRISAMTSAPATEQNIYRIKMGLPQW